MRFFSDTGIQFFGVADTEYVRKTDIINGDDGTQTTYDFAARLFVEEWLPISLDNETVLLRFYIGKSILFALDTTIRNVLNHSHSLTKNDVSTTLRVHDKLNSNNNNLLNDIYVNAETSEWIKSIYDRKHIKPEYEEYDPILSYKAFIEQYIKESQNDFIPKIEILADQAFAAGTIDANLYVDLGNSRTIGLIVEKDINENKLG